MSDTLTRHTTPPPSVIAPSPKPPPKTADPINGSGGIPAGGSAAGMSTSGDTFTGTSGASLTGQSAFDFAKSILQSWGLSSLVPQLNKLLQGGVSTSDELTLSLEQTPEYKARFAGNAQRVAAGLPALTPAQYISQEEQYSQVLKSYGLPSGFYDSHADFNNLIGNDVSVNELQTRAQIAHDTYTNADQNYKDAWSQLGYTPGQAIAGILDPTKATSVIQDQANQAALIGNAADNGLKVSASRAQQFLQHGTTLADAQKAYASIAQSIGTDTAIGNRFGTQFGQTQEENSALLNDVTATRQKQNLYAEEAGLFGGHSGADSSTLSTAQSY